MTNVAINGLGRIGRATMKIILDDSRFNLVGVNDIVSTSNLAYLLKYDTVYGRWGKSVAAGDMELRIGGRSFPVLSERDPGRLPWRALGADLVFECTGVFSRREDLARHIAAWGTLCDSFGTRQRRRHSNCSAWRKHVHRWG